MDELEPLRHDAIRALAGAVATDRLPIGEFESRLTLVRQAPNRATLDAIVADLLPSGSYMAPAGLMPVVADHAAVAPVEPAPLLRISSVLGSTKRAGSWTVPLALELHVVLGELVVDLKDAVFEADVLDIEIDVLLGNLVLIVPAGAQVENECEERMSSSTYSTRSARGASRPIGLLIRIAGKVRLGTLVIKERRPTADTPEPTGWRRLLGRGD